MVHDISETSYDVVSNTNICFHKDGRRPYGCFKEQIKGSNCENECTRLDKCVAFSHGQRCYLWVSSTGCPSEWTPLAATIAKSASSLIEGSGHKYNCKVKKGMIVLNGNDIHLSFYSRL